jgi:uncharacterized protein (DUF1499 family)
LDFSALVLASSPNQYLVCPTDFCQKAEAHLESPVYGISAKVLKDVWFKVVDQQPRITIAQTDDKALKYKIVQRTALVRFPDNIHVEFLSLKKNKSTLAVYSKSVYGRSDFGVNKKRINNWLDLVQAEVDAN